MRFTFLIASVCMLFLAGCAIQPAQATKEELLKTGGGQGILLASYARPSPKERFSTESMYFRRVGERKFREIGVNTLPLVPLKFDFEEDGSYGSLFVMSLPAGDYEICDFAVSQDVLGGSITHSPQQRFSIPFRVVEGRVCYLGELKIDRIRAAKVLGLPGSDKVRFELSDQSKRDLPLMRKKYPEIELPTVIVKPTADHSTAFIRIE